MKNRLVDAITWSSLLFVAGCSFHARSAEKYRDDTRALLETRDPVIKQCYDTALTSQNTLAGNVGITFVVEPKTGNIMNPAIDPATTTAPEALSQCVLNAVQGLTLAPPDEREGRATFVYEFTVNPPAPAG